MSEIKECSSTPCLSITNKIKNNENEEITKLQTITPMEETGNEILCTLNKDTKQSIEVSNLPNDDLVTPIPDTCTVKFQSLETQEIATSSPVMEQNNSLPMVHTDDKILISKLEKEVKEKINERDMYQRKLEETKKKLAILEATIANTINSTDNNEANAYAVLTELKNKLTETTMQLEDRGVMMANQEKQINALNHQVTTLKEVVAITRDLLQIRNTEVKHLQAEVDDMETRIAEEREKHNTMMSKMDAAVRLNSDLKKEYETQLGLFKDLRIKYDEKITLLSEEKRALELANQSTINQKEEK